MPSRVSTHVRNPEYRSFSRYRWKTGAGRGGGNPSEGRKDRETFHGFIATHSTSNYSSCELACNLAGNTTPGNPGVPHPSPAWICARASFLFRRFTLPRDRGRPSRWAKERTKEGTDIPSTFETRWWPRMCYKRRCTRRIPFIFYLSPFLFLFFLFFLSFSGSKDRHVLTFPSILLKTSKTTPVTGFFLEEVPSSFLFFLFCAVRACGGKEYRLWSRARVDESWKRTRRSNVAGVYITFSGEKIIYALRNLILF